MNNDIEKANGDFKVVSIEPEKPMICLDCGKTFMETEAEAAPVSESEDVTLCPRCLSANNTEYVEATHQDIEIRVPDNYKHPAEEKARELFNRVTDLTGWREGKVRFWFQQQNPLLGMVSPEWMLMNDKGDRLEKFIAEAEDIA